MVWVMLNKRTKTCEYIDGRHSKHVAEQIAASITDDYILKKFLTFLDGVAYYNRRYK